MTTTLSVTRDQIISAALRKLQVYGSGVTIPAQDITDAAFALNLFVKAIAKKGTLVWCLNEISFPTTTNISVYPIGPTAGYVNITYTIMNPGTGGTNGTYAITFNDTTGTGAAGTYTISGGGITSINVTNGGSGYSQSMTPSFPLGGVSGAVVDIDVVGLTTNRPMRIMQTFIRDAYGNDQDLQITSRFDYNLLGQKTTNGVPNQCYYDPQFPNGLLTLYNVPVDNTETIHVVSQRQIQDFNLSTDNPDFPQEEYEMLVYGLADRLALDYEVKASVRQEIAMRAKMAIDDLADFEQENVSVYFAANKK